MRVASVCSGIGGAELAFAGLAEHVFAAEIEPFPRAVLAHHFPRLPVHGDFTEIGGDDTVDVLVGGTPCQSFSIAGLRGGMADARGNLALEFLRLAARLRARWILWENVPGVLSSSGGRDFGAFLGGLAELGYGWSYRVLDAQFFGLAQRRKRVFVVGHLGDWRRAAAVLFEPSSLRGHPSPRREARERIAGTLESGANRTGGTRPPGSTADSAESLIANPLGSKKDGGWRGDLDNDSYVVARSLNAHPSRIDGESETSVAYRTSGNCGAWDTGDRVDALNTGTDPASHLIAHSLRADGFDASEDGTGRGTPLVTTLAIRGRGDSHDLEWREDGTANAVLTPNGGRGGIGVGAIAFTQNQRDEVRAMDIAGALLAEPGMKQQTYALQTASVRRLTPGECEKLQGFPPGWTAIDYRGKPAADGPRYRALGNAFAVPVVRWIARRLAREHASLPLERVA